MSFKIENGVLVSYIPEEDETDVIIPYGVTEIGEKAFFRCHNVENITIPESVVKIGKNAFRMCKNLKTADLPDNLTELPDGLFAMCRKFERITIPSSVTEIGQSVFNDCNSSQSTIIIPDGVTKIGTFAFGYSRLKDIYIPESVTEMGDFPFYETVTIHGIAGSYAEEFAAQTNRDFQDDYDEKVNELTIDLKDIITNALKDAMSKVFEDIADNECELEVKEISRNRLSFNNYFTLEIPDYMTFHPETDDEYASISFKSDNCDDDNDDMNMCIQVFSTISSSTSVDDFLRGNVERNDNPDSLGYIMFHNTGKIEAGLLLCSNGRLFMTPYFTVIVLLRYNKLNIRFSSEFGLRNCDDNAAELKTRLIHLCEIFNRFTDTATNEKITLSPDNDELSNLVNKVIEYTESDDEEDDDNNNERNLNGIITEELTDVVINDDLVITLPAGYIYSTDEDITCNYPMMDDSSLVVLRNDKNADFDNMYNASERFCCSVLDKFSDGSRALATYSLKLFIENDSTNVMCDNILMWTPNIVVKYYYNMYNFVAVITTRTTRYMIRYRINLEDEDEIHEAEKNFLKILQTARLAGEPYNGFSVTNLIDMFEKIPETTPENDEVWKFYNQVKQNMQLQRNLIRLCGPTMRDSPEYCFNATENAIGSDNNFPEAEKAWEISKIFAVSENAPVEPFDENRDRQVEIQHCIIRNPFILHALRSFAWCSMEYCETENKQYSDLTLDELLSICQLIETRQICYKENDRYSALCNIRDAEFEYVCNRDKNSQYGSDYGDLIKLREELLSLSPLIDVLVEFLRNSRPNNEIKLDSAAADVVYAWCSMMLAATHCFACDHSLMDYDYEPSNGDFSEFEMHSICPSVDEGNDEDDDEDNDEEYGRMNEQLKLTYCDDVPTLRSGQKIVLDNDAETVQFYLQYEKPDGKFLIIDERAFIFDEKYNKLSVSNVIYNWNWQDKEESIIYYGRQDWSDFSVNIAKIPESVQKIAICYAIGKDLDDKIYDVTFGELKDIHMKIFFNRTQHYDFPIANLKNEKSIVAVELYRYKDNWKINCISAGYEAGIEKLYEEYGVENQ